LGNPSAPVERVDRDRDWGRAGTGTRIISRSATLISMDLNPNGRASCAAAPQLQRTHILKYSYTTLACIFCNQLQQFWHFWIISTIP